MVGPITLARSLSAWRERARFRSSLSRLVEDPHLAADLGFDLSSIKAERARLPWEPIRLRRGPAARDSGSSAVSAGRRPAAAVTPAVAERT